MVLFNVFGISLFSFLKNQMRNHWVFDRSLCTLNDKVGNRFWTETISLISLSDDSNITAYLDSFTSLPGLQANLAQHLNSTSSEVGIVIVPRLNKMVPIHNGIFQYQHACSFNITGDEAILCGFYPRATHIVDISERDMDINRFHTINKILVEIYGIEKDELLSEKYAGTPPARIYRSFVYPRAKPNYLMDPLERAAQRTATQIDLALRQVRADEATYLRNTDREISSHRDAQPIAFLLDNLRSAFNVGSIFRTAETGGVAEICTIGITPHPPNNSKLRKTAFSSIDVVPSTHFDDVMQSVDYLRKNGYCIVVLETTSQSILYTDVVYPDKVALVVGNELTGVDTRLIEAADVVVEIPTYGVKNSLNVASAAPIVLYEVLRQLRGKKPLAGINGS